MRLPQATTRSRRHLSTGPPGRLSIARGGAPGSWSTRVKNTDLQQLNTLLLTNVNTALSGALQPSARRQRLTNMGWYNNVLAVDPVDGIECGSLAWTGSDPTMVDRTWGLASTPRGPGPWQMHVDQHGIAFHPE